MSFGYLKQFTKYFDQITIKLFTSIGMDLKETPKITTK